MEAANVLTDRLAVQPKKSYTKPVLNKIRLVAEEAVLGFCKYNSAASGFMCEPDDLNCEFAARS